LPNPTLTLGETEEITIDADRKRGNLNTFHDKMNKPCREPQELKEIMKKRPLDRIKCFLEINLDGAARGYTLMSISPQELLHEVNIICHESPFKKSVLRRADNIIEHMSQPSY